MSRTALAHLPELLFVAALLAGAVTASSAALGAGEDYPPNGEFLEVDGVRLHYIAEGPQAAPTVLVLHGASGNLNEPRLALSGQLDDLRTIYLDRPGLGWSERPGGVWSPEREAALIADFMTALDIDDATVVGHSWGGAITLRLALDHPDRVNSIVLIAPAIRAWVGEAAFYNKATHWPVLGTLITRIVVPTYGRGQLEGGAVSAFAPEPMPSGYVEATRLPLILRASAWKANAFDMANVNHSLAAQEERYGEISVPAILIAGTEDDVVATNRHAVPVSQTMPNAELILIEGAGHNPHHHHTATVTDAIRTVIARAGG